MKLIALSRAVNYSKTSLKFRCSQGSFVMKLEQKGTRAVSAQARAPGRHSLPLSRRRLWLFRLVAASLPFVVLLLMEIVFRVVPGLNEDRDPYVNISPVSVFSRKTIEGKEYYTITHRYVLGGSSVRILVDKPANTIRVFCLGSSACAGWPHPQAETFSAYLQQALERAYPGKNVEIVNAAAHGFAAYRDRRVLDEVIQMQPDAVLVWEGNNEFLEERNYDPPNVSIVALGRHLRVVQWLQSMLSSRTELAGEDLKGVANFFWKKARQQSLLLREDPVQFAQVQEHFRKSFEHMVHQSQSHQIPIILCTVPVNMRDWLPTVSHNRLAGEQRQQWQKLYNQARRCLLDGRPKDGIQTMQQAIAMESEHAESYFWLGRLLEADDQKAEAWQAFSKARDQDYNPFRALSSFNETIRSLANENQAKGVHLLDLEQLFAGASRYAAPGFDLFLDYVHPTKTANLIVAKNVYNLLLKNILKSANGTDCFLYEDSPSGPSRKPYCDEDDASLQSTVISMTMLNRQFEAVVSQAEILVRRNTGQRLTGPDDPALKVCPLWLRDAYRVSHKYLDIQRRVILDLPVSEAEDLDAKTQMSTFYDKYYPYGKI